MILGNHDGIKVGSGFLAEVMPNDQEEFTRKKLFENAGESTKKASGVGAHNLDARENEIGGSV